MSTILLAEARFYPHLSDQLLAGAYRPTSGRILVDGVDLLKFRTADGRQHMEYVSERGTFDELPFDQIMGATREWFSMPYQDGSTTRFIWGATAAMLRNFYRFLSA